MRGQELLYVDEQGSREQTAAVVALDLIGQGAGRVDKGVQHQGIALLVVAHLNQASYLVSVGAPGHCSRLPGG